MSEPESVRLHVWHKPVTQGSFQAVFNRANPRRPFVRMSNDAAVQKFRRAVVNIGIDYMDGLEPMTGALQVVTLVTVGVRPQTRLDSVYPTQHDTGDIDKYLRAIFDGLGGAQGGPVVADDSLIVNESTRKRWVGIAGGLPAPGIRVTVTRMPVEALTLALE